MILCITSFLFYIVFFYCIEDTLNQEYFNKLYAEYELVCQRCLEELEHLVVSTHLFLTSTKLRTSICTAVPDNELFHFCEALAMLYNGAMTLNLHSANIVEHYLVLPYDKDKRQGSFYNCQLSSYL